MNPLERRTVVNLAGPAYSPEERDAMAGLAALLEGGGFEVYFESRDGIPPELFTQACRESDYIIEKAAFALEVHQVQRCECLVFNMNGRVPDDNGAFLAAVAFTIGKPVVLYKRDHRTKLCGNDNAMISGLSFDFKPVKKTRRLPGEIMRAIERCRKSNLDLISMPPLVRLNAELGREVWDSLLRFRVEPSAPLKDLHDELTAACKASKAYNVSV